MRTERGLIYYSGEIMLLEIKIAILKSGRRGYEIARSLDWPPSKLSAVINESYTPTSIEKEDLANELGGSVNELFPPGRPRVTA